MEPNYADESVTLYHGDCRVVVHDAELTADCIVADPPYGETLLPWDRWPSDWPTAVSDVARSMWCFGSMRMFLDRRDEFAVWRLSQDVVWEKHNGSGFAADRFKRVHETATFWYRGDWPTAHHDVPREVSTRTDSTSRATRPLHLRGGDLPSTYQYGEPLMRSVIRIRSMHSLSIHPTEKPVGILDPLIRYACPPGGTVVDPFAGSGSTAVAARMSGRKALLIEADERYCELIVKRLAQDVLPFAEQTSSDERDGVE